MEDDTSVRVAVRIRPQISREIIDMCRICTTVTPDEPQVVLGNDKAFTFDYVFEMNSEQKSIYDTCVQQLIEGCFEGYNATVLAYGQTGSGKTYTMGTGFDINICEEELGVIPRAVEHLFEGIEERRQRAYANNEPLPDFKIHCQFMELYNEDIIDLFDTARGAYSKNKRSAIKIHEDSKGGIFAVGVTTKVVTSKQDTLQCLKVGALSRTTASTNMNVQSSRSHAIFTLHVKQQRLAKSKDPDVELDSTDAVDEFETLTAKFHFVDLAGSERLKRTGATGDRAKEGISINSGLLALGNVISALGDVTKRGSHVPYRDSKLTRLLQDSLGGNSRTLMIACISPSDRDFMETLNTLKYANRARNITNRVIANQDKNSKTIAALRLEVQMLQLELLEYKQGKRVIVDGEENINDMFHENTMLQTENSNLRIRIKALQETIEGLSARNTVLLVEKAAGEWISSSGENSDVNTIVHGYVKELEDLRVKLMESEHTCHTLRRSMSRTQTRLSMSPLRSHAVAVSGIYDIGSEAEMGSVDEVLKEAKEELEELRHFKKLKKRSKLAKELLEQGDVEPSFESNNDADRMEGEENEDEEKEETLENENYEEEESSTSTSGTDTDENERYRSDLASLTCEISIKQKLIQELELSQKRMQTMRLNYEEKLSQLQNKIRATQEERDKVLASLGNVENVSEERTKRIKEDYERKLREMTQEHKKIQVAKKEHARFLKTQDHYEKQMKVLQGEVADMKRAKVRLMNKIKEEALRHKESEQRRNREITQLQKESQKKQNRIRTLEADKKLKDVVLRRKQEEVSALRKMAKPMSDSVAGRVPKSRQFARHLQQAERKCFSPKVIKSKWQNMEKEITKSVLDRKTISNLEEDMNRFLKDRERLSQNLEKCIKKRDTAILHKKVHALHDLDDQIETLKANIDYIQETIADYQANIIQVESAKEGQCLDINSVVVAGMTMDDIKYLMSKLLNMTISQSLLATQREDCLKEAEAKLRQSQLNNQVHQELLEHVLQSQGMDLFRFANGSEDASSVESMPSSRSDSPIDGTTSVETATISSSSTDAMKQASKARRRTAANPQELLFEHGLAMGSIEPVVETETAASPENVQTMPVVPRAPPISLLNVPGPLASAVQSSRVFLRTSRRTGLYNNNNRNTIPSSSAARHTNNDDLATPPPSPTPSRRGRDENVFSRLTVGTTSNDTVRCSTGTIEPYVSSKPTSRSSPLTCLYEAKGHSQSVLAVVATDTLMFSASTDRTVKVWDLHRGNEITSLGGHANNVVAVRYCERTSQVFTASSAYVKVWDFRESNSRCIKTLHSSGQLTDGPISLTGPSRVLGVPSGEHQINDVAVDKYGTTIFSAAGPVVRVWDLRNYCNIGKLSGGHQAAVTCLSVEDVAGQDTCVATGSKDHYVKLFKIPALANGIHQPKLELEPPHYDGIQALALNDTVLFSGSRDMCIKKWDVKRSKLKKSLNQAHKDWVCGLCFLPSYKNLLSCCRGGYVRLWSVESCHLIGEVKAHGSAVNAITANSSCVFTASSDNTVRIWRVPSVTDIASEVTS